MKTVLFMDSDENVSSKRNWKSSGMYKTSYPNEPGRGGTTFVNKYSYARYDKDGRLMSWGIKNGRNITHFDKNNRLQNDIAAF